MADLEKQTAALERTDWHVLVILDACRIDYFRPLCIGGAPAVRSPATCTRQWFKAMLNGGCLDGATYVNANPVVQDVVTNRDEVPLDVQYFRRGGDGTVYPETLTDWVLDRARSAGQPERLVVHYLQPHLPNIGDWDEAAGHWPEDAEEPGDRAYAANLWRAWVQVCRLIKGLRGRIVVTSDHGEMLGEEDGKRGHECHWDHPVLRRVPWLVVADLGGHEASGADDWSTGEEPDEEEIKERMRKLGYVE